MFKKLLLLLLSFHSLNGSVCGNGLKELPEECDDSNIVDGDGCSYLCKVEKNWVCDSASPSVCSLVCGNGIKENAEECDDGNNRVLKRYLITKTEWRWLFRLVYNRGGLWMHH